MSKRTAGEGSVFERKDGRWCATLDLGRQGGKRQRRTFYGATASEVRDKLLQARADLSKGVKPAAARAITLNDFAQNFLERATLDLRPNTHRNYEYLLRVHILPRLGKKRLTAISRPMVKALLADLRKNGLGKNTVRLARATLSVLLAEAVDDGLLQVNPALSVSRRRRDRAASADRHLSPLSEVETDRLLAAAHGTPEYPLFLLLARTGLRPGEGYALEWPDIDFNAGQIAVTKGVAMGATGPTKTGRARRVDMTPAVADALRRLRSDKAARALADGTGEASDMVFSNGAGGHLDESRVRKAFVRAMRKAGLSGHRLYDLRHSYATSLLKTGAPITYVAAQLGHANASTTLRWYARWLPDSNRRYADALDGKAGEAQAKLERF